MASGAGAALRVPGLRSTRPDWNRWHGAAAARVEEALARGDWRTAAALGRCLPLVAPGQALAWAKAALTAGDGPAATALLDAHVAGGGGVAALSQPAGQEGRLLEAVATAVRAGWGRQPVADAAAAAQLAELFLQVDPTDSYLFAAAWARAAAGLPASAAAAGPLPRTPPGEPAGPEEAAAALRALWTAWFGCWCGPAGWSVCVPPALPLRRLTWEQLALDPQGRLRADLQVEQGVVRVRAGQRVLAAGVRGQRLSGPWQEAVAGEG